MLQKLSQTISLLAGIAYIVMGGLVMYNRSFVITLQPVVAYALGVVLIAYGLFRIVRGIRSLFSQNSEE